MAVFIALLLLSSVANAQTNNLPTGGVTIISGNSSFPLNNGVANAGLILQATHTLADGPATLSPSYQWNRSDTAAGVGSPISGATAEFYDLTAADSGKFITVTASYTDGGGTAESVTSAPLRINTPPTISGTPALTATQGQLYRFEPVGMDADGDTLTYTIGGSPPAWLSIDASTGVVSGTPTNAGVGDASFTVTVTDGFPPVTLVVGNGGLILLMVTNVNDAPTITGTPAETVAQDTPYSFTPTGDDIDVGDTLTYLIENQPTWADFDDTSGALTGTPTSTDVGTTTDIVISVRDSATPPLTAALAGFNLAVTSTDAAPPAAPAISASTSTLTATVGVLIDPITITSSGGDVDSYSIDPPIGNGLSFSTASGEISGTPATAAAEVIYTITAINTTSTVQPRSLLPSTPPTQPWRLRRVPQCQIRPIHRAQRLAP